MNSSNIVRKAVNDMHQNKWTSIYGEARVHPKGWLLKQLRLEADGLTGHLDTVWPDIKDNKWLGGDREGWERVPYWLDGFVPLAWLLNDDEMKARAKRCVDFILSRQKEDGWLCPCEDGQRASYDIWAFILMLKVLALYADLSGDERIEPAVERALRCIDGHIDRYGIHRWALARWFECLIPIYWLYGRKPADWLIRLADKLRALGVDYPMLARLQDIDEPQPHWNFWRHVVNLATAIKEPAMLYPLAGGDPGGEAESYLSDLMRKNSMVIGHFSGDECLTGDSCTAGTELCGVAEAMYSYEWLLLVTGETRWADRLEYLAFNGFAATVSADMWTHQYLQTANQIACAPFPRDDNPFRTNGVESNMFGLEPNFGCCTANMGQAWPKLALHAFLKGDGELVSAVLTPGEIDTVIGGAHVRCALDTAYPFGDQLTYTVETDRPAAFALTLRIPGFAAEAKVDNCNVPAGAFHRIERVWDGRVTVRVSLRFAPEFIDRPNGLKALRVGPILYSLPLKEEWTRVEYERDGVARKFPYCDYHVTSDDPFAFGFAAPAETARVTYAAVGDKPFSAECPPAYAEIEMAPVEWKKLNGRCADMPESAVPVGEKKLTRLVPYGCARLRMTEMPLCEP